MNFKDQINLKIDEALLEFQNIKGIAGLAQLSLIFEKGGEAG